MPRVVVGHHPNERRYLMIFVEWRVVYIFDKLNRESVIYGSPRGLNLRVISYGGVQKKKENRD